MTDSSQQFSLPCTVAGSSCEGDGGGATQLAVRSCLLLACLLLCWRVKPDSLKRGSRREPNYFICPERIPQDRRFTIGNLLTRTSFLGTLITQGCVPGTPCKHSNVVAPPYPRLGKKDWWWKPYHNYPRVITSTIMIRALD